MIKEKVMHVLIVAMARVHYVCDDNEMQCPDKPKQKFCQLSLDV